MSITKIYASPYSVTTLNDLLQVLPLRDQFRMYIKSTQVTCKLCESIDAKLRNKAQIKTIKEARKGCKELKAVLSGELRLPSKKPLISIFRKIQKIQSFSFMNNYLWIPSEHSPKGIWTVLNVLPMVRMRNVKDLTKFNKDLTSAQRSTCGMGPFGGALFTYLYEYLMHTPGGVRGLDQLERTLLGNPMNPVLSMLKRARELTGLYNAGLDGRLLNGARFGIKEIKIDLITDHLGGLRVPDPGPGVNVSAIETGEGSVTEACDIVKKYAGSLDTRWKNIGVKIDISKKSNHSIRLDKHIALRLRRIQK